MKRYEKEIRDLLDKMDSFVPEAPPQEREQREREPKKKASTVSTMPPQPRPIRPKVGPGARFNNWLASLRITGSLRFMLFGVALIIGGLILNETSNRSQVLVTQILIAVGAVMFLMPLLLRFWGNGRSLDNDNTQYWRGVPVDRESTFTWKKLKGWFGGKRNNRDNNDPWNNNRPRF